MAAFGITALLIIFAGLTVPVVFGGEDYSAPVEPIPKIPMDEGMVVLEKEGESAASLYKVSAMK